MTTTYRGVTIDGITSRDLDDAVWVEKLGDGWKVTVSISLVSSSVEIGTLIDEAARAVGFTVYAASAVRHPMLPPALSEDSLSLLPGYQREVMGFVIVLNKDLSVRSVTVGTGVLENLGRLDHATAGELIKSGEGSLGLMLRDAWQLSSSLLDKRRLGGSLAYFSIAEGVVTDEEGRIIELDDFNHTATAYVLVQELMILTNSAVTANYVTKGVALLFRNHRSNPVADRDTLREDMEIVSRGGIQTEAAAKRLSMMLGRATLGSKATGHFGLNLPVYAWLTSPIRRYADLVNQRLILAHENGEPSPYLPAELDAFASHINERSLQENEERASSFREMSERRATQLSMARDLGSLDVTEMTSVIKLASQTRLISTGLEQEIERRISAGRLTAKDAARVLLMDGEHAADFRRSIIDVLVSVPHQAVSILSYMEQDKKIEALQWDETIGQSRAEARLNGTRRCVEAFSENKKLGKQRSAVALLAAFFSEGWKPPEEWLRAAVDATFTVDVNAKGNLLAYCQSRGLTAPVIEVTQSGPSHAPKFVAVANLVKQDGNITSGRCNGGSRKDAERAAAAKLLSMLAGVAPAPVTAARSAQAAGVSPKTLLQEVCQKRGWPLPTYEISQQGLSHRPNFQGHAQIKGAGVELKSIMVKAGSRKEAEKLAALNILSTFTR